MRPFPCAESTQVRATVRVIIPPQIRWFGAITYKGKNICDEIRKCMDLHIDNREVGVPDDPGVARREAQEGLVCVSIPLFP